MNGQRCETDWVGQYFCLNLSVESYEKAQRNLLGNPIHTIEYYSAIKKEWNNAICSNMDGPRDDGTKWSQIK